MHGFVKGECEDIHVKFAGIHLRQREPERTAVFVHPFDLFVLTVMKASFVRIRNQG